MSNLSIQVQSILEDLFPANPHKRIFCEYYIKYKNQKLFFDFFIKDLGILFECQGQQHFKYTKHFHGDKDSFIKHKERDNLKIEYVQENDLYLVTINYNEVITKELILSKMKKVLESESNYFNS